MVALAIYAQPDMSVQWKVSMRSRTLIMSSFSLALLMSVFAHGQAPQRVTAKIPFSFTAAGKVLPAGEYDFTSNTDSSMMRVAASGSGNPQVLQQIITRLSSAIHTTPRDAHIVFDRIGDSHILSEIWIPGFDGYLMNPTKATHQHVLVDVPITK